MSPRISRTASYPLHKRAPGPAQTDSPLFLFTELRGGDTVRRAKWTGGFFQRPPVLMTCDRRCCIRWGADSVILLASCCFLPGEARCAGCGPLASRRRPAADSVRRVSRPRRRADRGRARRAGGPAHRRVHDFCPRDGISRPAARSSHYTEASTSSLPWGTHTI